MSKHYSMRCALMSAAIFSFSAAAEAQQSNTETAPASKIQKAEKITVKATLLDAPVTELAQPATVLGEEDLRRKRAASLGDTLSHELGVQSSAFGPGAGRPIIRGLDGPRIRVLENGVGTLDVSTISPDHMVTTESSHAEQIEILRGPASLLYGSGAIGGVVNVVSNLIPAVAQTMLTGNLELRTASATQEKTAAVNLAGGNGSMAWHLDGFKRKTANYKIPGRVNPDDSDSPSGKLPDSYVDAQGTGAGISWTGAGGYLGAGVSSLRNHYGIPSGEGTHIALRQTRYETAGEAVQPFSNVERIKFRLAHNDYQHAEIESSGEVGTTFKNKGTETRLEVQHLPIAGFKGAFGLQLQDQDFAALGEEAIIPPTQSRARALFVVEQKEIGNWTLNGGVRFERESRRPESDLPSRNFSLGTISTGLVWKFLPEHNFSVNFTQAQRAPSVEELYSHGAHHATATFDMGDPALGKEASRNVDLTLRKTSGALKWKINVFANRMKNYVFAKSIDSNGDGMADRLDDEGALTPDGEFLVQQFSHADAHFRGYEAELVYQPEKAGAALRVFTDRVQGRLVQGGNLPRISPPRFGVEWGYARGPWSHNLTVMRVQKQNRVAELETPTPGYTKVNAEISYLWNAPGASYLLFLQGNNLLDRDIRVHTSYLKHTAPQSGRSLNLGLRVTF